MEVFQVVQQLGGVSLDVTRSRGEHLIESDASAVVGDAALHEMLEDVGHGEIGDVGVLVLESSDGVDILHDRGGHSDHIPVGKQGALGNAGGAAGVADHAEIVLCGGAGREGGGVLEGVDELPEGVERDGVLLGGGAKRVVDGAHLGERGRERGTMTRMESVWNR